MSASAVSTVGGTFSAVYSVGGWCWFSFVGVVVAVIVLLLLLLLCCCCCCLLPPCPRWAERFPPFTAWGVGAGSPSSVSLLLLSYCCCCCYCLVVIVIVVVGGGGVC